MAQIKVSALTGTATIADTDLFLLTKDIGGSLFASRKISKLDLVTALGFPPSWGLTGNSGTNPATNFIGTTDNIDFTVKTNSLPRAWFLNNGNITIGIGATSNSANIHIKGVTQMFQTHATPSSISPNKQINFDSSVTAPSMSFVTADNGSWRLFHRTSANANGGAYIRLGNDSDNSNLNGISIGVGLNSESSPNNSYAMHLTSAGECILTTKTMAVALGATTRAKLHVFTKGNSSGTVGVIIRNTDNVETFKVWDHQRIVTNRTAASLYSPVATLDFYSPLTGSSIFKQMESATGVVWEQQCNGVTVIGRGIAAGTKLGIKGDANAFVGDPQAALHVKGTIRLDGQSSASAGAATGTYLIINIDGVSRKIQLFNT